MESLHSAQCCTLYLRYRDRAGIAVLKDCVLGPVSSRHSSFLIRVGVGGGGDPQDGGSHTLRKGLRVEREAERVRQSQQKEGGDQGEGC